MSCIFYQEQLLQSVFNTANAWLQGYLTGHRLR